MGGGVDSERDGLTLPFRQAMSSLGTGVVMVTSYLEGRPWGTTVSACCSVSDSPPTLLVSLTASSVSARTVVDAGGFGVSILTERQLDVAAWGSARGTAKFIKRFCAEHGSDFPRVVGALAHLDCSVDATIDVADHTVIFGCVEDVVLPATADDRPLLYYSRAFRRIGHPLSQGEPAPAADAAEGLFFTVAHW